MKVWYMYVYVDEPADMSDSSLAQQIWKQS